MYRLAAPSTSSAERIPDTTATPAPPAARIGATSSGRTPPIATQGIPPLLATIARNPASPSAAPASALAEVAPRRAGRDRHVAPVVHQHRHVERRHQGPRDPQELPRRRLLEPELYAGHPAPHRRAAERDRIAPREERVIGDQQEAKRDR